MKFYLTIFLVQLCVFAQAQPELRMPKVPLNRQLFHFKIDEAQQKILQLHSSKDSILRVSTDESINLQTYQILITRINNLQAKIELDSTITDNDKIVWLRSIENLLRDFASYSKLKAIKEIFLGDLILAYEQCMKLQLRQKSIYPIIVANELEVGNILTSNFGLKSNIGLRAAKDELVLKLCRKYPQRILKILQENINVPFADSLIIDEAYKDQEGLYNYASMTSPLAQKIQAVNDPLVKTIGLLALMNSGRVYFPFLDDLYRNKLSLDTLTKLKNNPDGYYSLLVKTEIEYATRMLHGDTPLVKNVLTEKLKTKGIENYIDTINGLHDERSDAVRFKRIDKLSPTELYYLCVLSEQEIYTSSYLGVYKRIFERMAIPRGDTLLQAVNYDYYKKFLKMASAYNTLDDFLNRMDAVEADTMMRKFASGLERAKTLEDAVDVADSYASISDAKLQKLILDQVYQNLQMAIKNGNTRGERIYNLLNTIFLSMDVNNNVDISQTLGINPVFKMPIALLKDSGNRIIIQQFFYGDKDGNNVFNSFLANFRNANWKIINKPEWVEVKSTKGTAITIYANKPLDELKDLDALAQAHLGEYLDSLSLNPTVVIHRGHSYFVKSTINQLPSSAKVVLLGSCGGYQSLNEVLNKTTQAQIISSKQVGTGLINQSLINKITDELRNDRDLNWPQLWKGFESQFKGDSKEKFDDYIPPHKNLGAIFMMAYDKANEVN
jgi:hypothetical protein